MTSGGDTVNMASRMESHGISDQIQITRPTWELLREHFVTEPIGLIDVKGKGKVDLGARRQGWPLGWSEEYGPGPPGRETVIPCPSGS
jgi:adenylate/guanylate cyclase family protein